MRKMVRPCELMKFFFIVLGSCSFLEASISFANRESSFILKDGGDETYSLVRFNPTSILGWSDGSVVRDDSLDEGRYNIANYAVSKVIAGGGVIGVAPTALIRTNSIALVRYASIVRNNSYLLRWTSNTLAYNYRVNSNQLAYDKRITSNTLNQIHMEIADLESGENGAIIASRIDDLYVKFRNSSNSMLYNFRTTTNAIAYQTRIHSNAYVFNHRVDSRAINTITGRMNPRITGSVKSNITLKQDLPLSSTEYLLFENSVTIDGQGQKILFTGATVIAPHVEVSDEDDRYPQFIIENGKTVVLKNVKLTGVRAHTFEFEGNAKLEIGENVTFEFCEDCTLKWNVRCIGTAVQPTVLTFKGIDTQKNITLEKSVRKFFDLGVNSLHLENIKLSGAQNLAISRTALAGGVMLIGSLGLFGNAVVELAESPEMSFYVEHTNNNLLLMKDKLLFQWPIRFDADSDAELHVNFALSGKDQTQTPQVTFANNCLRLESLAKSARLFFDAPWTTVINDASDSFVLGNNAYLAGQRVEVAKNPIKVTSRSFTMDHNLALIAADIDPLGLFYDVRIKPAKQAHAVHKPVSTISTRGIDSEETKNDFIEYEDFAVKAITGLGASLLALPAQFDLRVNNIITLRQAQGSIFIDGGVVENFNIAAGKDVQIYLGENALVQQGDSSVTIKPTDTLYVCGKNNVINVTSPFIVQGRISFEVGAELTFVFDNGAKNAAVIFPADTIHQLDLPENAKLTFKGKGTVSASDGFLFLLKGNATQETYPLLAIQDSAQFIINGTGQVFIGGKGRLLLNSGGTMQVGAGQHLVFGQSDTDALDVLIDRYGAIRVDTLDTPEATEVAKVSFRQPSYDLNLGHGGCIFVGNKGIFEVNGFNGMRTFGALRTFTIGFGGTLFVDDGGSLSVYTNRRDKATRMEIPFTWRATGGTFGGNGVIQYENTLFAGKRVNLPTSGTQFTALDFVRKAINQNPALSVSTYFITQENKKKLRTQTGVIVDLLDDDEVSRDDATTGVVYGYNNGNFFTISSNGNRQ